MVGAHYPVFNEKGVSIFGNAFLLTMNFEKSVKLFKII
jgi:hypothetical protein